MSRIDEDAHHLQNSEEEQDQAKLDNDENEENDQGEDEEANPRIGRKHTRCQQVSELYQRLRRIGQSSEKTGIQVRAQIQ